ncbi:head GIN domain-containing protein [Pontibacter rugosus]|uniref:Head GIN domain-containing protein n=1 Tax=Pontibacter rugosus TaxID=1745966 RepID=A0ABW3SVH0_9BACT
MKILKLPFLFLATAVVAFSCDDKGFCLEGEGGVETRTLDMAAISGVEVSGSTKVYISRGNPQRVEVRGQGNVLDELETEVDNGVWDIEFDRCLRNHKKVEIHITVPELHVARVGGSGSIELEDVFESREFKTSVSGSGNVLLRVATDKLDARISGSGTIRAAGVANEQDISISGSGNYLASDVNSKKVEVNVSGSGEAEVNAANQLDAKISGSGRVYYTGNPSVNTSVSGSGKVIKK